MSALTESREATGYAVGPGKPPPQHQFKPGTSGNPGGRPKDAARLVREKLGGSPAVLAEALLDIVRGEDPKARVADRISAARELWDRGWGKAQGFNPLEGDALGWDEVASEIRKIAQELEERRKAA